MTKHLISTFYQITALFILVLNSACISPSAEFSKNAKKLGYKEYSYRGKNFDIVYFTKSEKTTKQLHVYLDGDGTPWILPEHISIDPTPRNSLMLNLMSIDHMPAIYLSRPCYLVNGKSRNCQPKWWTSHRYSQDIVDAMANAINSLNKNKAQITLIGFSGGGALAVLMADQIRYLNKIITINANLDIAQWTESHGYTPLTGSLNPIEYLPKPDIKMLHLFGGQDQNIDAKYLSTQINQHNNTNVRIYNEFTHHCCWQNIWQSILSEQ